MKTFNRIIACLILTCGLFAKTGNGQTGVLNPADPIVIYKSATPPATPAYGELAKWVKTTRVSWSTTSFKAYYYNGVSFRLKFPKSYQHNVNDGKTYPIFVFFHGVGERGTIYDNEYQLLHGGQTHGNAVDNNKFDGFLLYIQSATPSGSFGDSYFAVVKDLIENYFVPQVKVDPFRVLVGGLSGGGGATWQFLINNPTLVAGAAPISAASLSYANAANSLKYTPIWHFQGALDNNPTPGTSQYLQTAFLGQGANYKLTIYPGVGHGCWTNAWAEANYFPFLSKAHKANPWPLTGKAEFCPGDPISATLGVTAGFDGYEWRKDGVLIPGATSNEYVATALGVYDCRIKKDTLWSVWSPVPVEVKMKGATVAPDISVSGLMSKVIPALDNSGGVTLSVPEGYAAYSWQKVGQPTNLSTANQVLVTTPGDYVVKVSEQFGCASQFSAPFTVIDANGGNKPDQAINLSVTTLSKTSLRLDWSDNPSPQFNETNFEIYQALQPGGPYTLAGIVGADVLNFTLNDLKAKTTYYYKVRAVNATGAAPSSVEATGTTAADILPPTAPSGLMVGGTTASSIALSWDPSTDDVGVNKYDIYINGKKSFVTTETSFTAYNLEHGKTYNFKVTARDLANNVSPFSNQVTAQPLRDGLTYKYYTFDASQSQLPNFSTLVPDGTGIIANVSLSPKQQNSLYGFLWEGYITIPTTGTYTFRTNSDDGSRLWIGALNGTGSPYVHGTSLVDNDGSHNSRNREGTITLTAGVYPFAAAYFQNTSSSTMNVYWKLPQSGSYVQIPNSAFADNTTPEGVAPVMPSNLKAVAQSYKSINLSWSDNSNNETGFEIWRSVDPEEGFITVGTAPANAVTYTDTALSAATRYFYKVRAIGTYGESDLTSNLMDAAWKLNNNYTDAGVYNRALTTNGSPVFDAANKQEGTHSLKLNGSNQYVSISNSGSFLQTAYDERTVALWIKSNNNSNNRVIFDLGGSDNGLALLLNNNTLIAAVASGSSRSSISASYSSSNWNHVAVVYKRNSLKLYVNGVQVATKDNLSYTNINSTTNGSRIGLTNSSNAYNTSGTYFNGWVDDIGIYSTALTPDALATVMNNTFVSSYAITPALPGAPAAPTALTAVAGTPSSVDINWTDNATNEEKFELYRSANNNTHYVLLATLPAGTQSYKDSSLFANAVYYYKVRALNVGGISSYSNESGTTTLNNLPVLNLTSGTKFVRFGTQLDLPVIATDADQGTLNITVNNLPAYGTYISGGNATGTIRFTPGAGDQGVYNSIVVTATDAHGGTATVTFNLEVNDNYNPALSGLANVSLSEKQTTQINLGATDQNAGEVLTWSFTGLPSFVTVNAAGGSAQLTATPGYADGGSYRVGVMVSDGRNGQDTGSFVITVLDVNPDKRILINFTSGITSAPAPWNNTNKPPVLNDVFGPFKDETGANTTMGIKILSSWQAMSNGTNELGAKTNNNTGVYPDVVMGSAYWSSTVQQTFKVTGLDVNAKYNFTFFGSRAGVTDDRTTVYTVKGVAVTLNAASNTKNTITAYNLVPDADSSLTVTIKNVSPSVYSYLNAMVIEALYDDHTAPAPVRELKGQLSGNQINLSWIDAAYNEDNYQIYRSTAVGGPYTLLNTNAKNTNAYANTGVSGNTTYYYYVKGTNTYGTGTSDTISVFSPNVAPVIAALADVMMKNNEVKNIGVAATDDAGDVITLTASGLPAFMSFTDNGNGAGVLHITPSSGIVGIYSGITITATDDKNAVSSKVISVAVGDKDVTSTYVNFNQFTPVGSPWNSFNTLPLAGTALTNLKDLLNVNTGITITLVDKWTGMNEVGAVTGNNSGVYPDDVMKTAYYEGTADSRTVRLSGLNTAQKYNLIFFGSRIASDDRTTVYASGGNSVSLNAAGNTKNTVALNGLVPNASGIIEFTVTKGGASAYAYLNALVIQSYTDNGLPLAPSNLTAVPNSKTAIKLNWSDKSNNETGFEVYRSSSPNGTYTLIATVAANVSTYTNTGLTANTAYYYKVRAMLNAAASSYSNVAVASTFSYQMFINFNRENPEASPWFNTNIAPQEGMTFDNINNEQGNPSGLAMTITKNFSGDNPFGMNTGTNSGVFPDNVIRSSWWIDAGSTAKLKISGLSQSMQYSFVFFGSRDGNGDKTTVYSINGKSASLQCGYNVNNTAQLDNVVADENGEIEVTVSLGATAEFGYLGAMVIKASNVPDSASAVTLVTNNVVATGTAIQTGVAKVAQSSGKVANAVVGAPLEAAKAVQADLTSTLSAYPNPFKDQLYVTAGFAEVQPRLTVKILDMSGRTVFTQEFRNVPAGKWNQELNTDNRIQQRGLYILQVIGNDTKKPVSIKIIRR